MATVTSASTDQEILDAYRNNASYEEDGSTSKAKAFITVCQVILGERPASAGTGGQNVVFNMAAVQKAIDTARRWLALNGGASGTSGGSVRHLSFRNLRD